MTSSVLTCIKSMTLQVKQRILQYGRTGVRKQNMLTTFHKSQHLSIRQSLVGEASKRHYLVQKYTVAPDIWRCTEYAVRQTFRCHPPNWEHPCSSVHKAHITAGQNSTVSLELDAQQAVRASAWCIDLLTPKPKKFILILRYSSVLSLTWGRSTKLPTCIVYLKILR